MCFYRLNKINEQQVPNLGEVKLSNGAGFIVCLCGSVLTMPRLPKIPAAVKMEDEE